MVSGKICPQLSFLFPIRAERYENGGMTKRLLRMLLALALVGFGAMPLGAETVYFKGKDAKAGYYLVPDNMPKDATKVWVAVHVHGAGGLRGENSGKDLAKLLGPEPVIVIVPSFTDGYQAGDGKWAAQLIANFKEVQKKYKVQDKMFIHGHSGGGQFAHRFAFAEPKYVCGVSAHSSGSWACAGGYGKINKSAKKIPFAISCGEADKDLSYPGAPHTRIEWYRLFEKEMKKDGFDVDGRTWPGVGHGVSMKLMGEQVKACFVKATKG